MDCRRTGAHRTVAFGSAILSTYCLIEYGGSDYYPVEHRSDTPAKNFSDTLSGYIGKGVVVTATMRSGGRLNNRGHYGGG